MATVYDTTGIVGQSRDAFANMLKDYYARLWDHHVHTAEMNKLMRHLGKKGGRAGGKKVIAAVVDELPQSAGISLLEGMKMPTPRVGHYFNPELLMKFIFARLRWTLEAVKSAAAGKKAAFIKPVALDVKDARKTNNLNMTRKLYLGHFDILGIVHAVSGTTVTVKARNDRTAASPNFWYFGTKYMRKNQSIAFVDTGDGVSGGSVGNSYLQDGSATAVDTNATERYITAVGGTQSAPSITVDSAISAIMFGSAAPAVGDAIVPWASRGFNADQAIDESTYGQSQFASFNGVMNIGTDDTHYSNLYNLPKATNSTLNGVYDSNSGTAREFAEARVRVLVDRIADEGVGDEPDVLFVNRSIRREVAAQFDSSRRFPGITEKFGHKRLAAAVGDSMLPFEADNWCPPGLMAAFRTDSWNWVSLCDQQPVFGDLKRWVADYAQEEMLWFKAGNFQCKEPFNQGIYDDVAFDVWDLRTS